MADELPPSAQNTVVAARRVQTCRQPVADTVLLQMQSQVNDVGAVAAGIDRLALPVFDAIRRAVGDFIPVVVLRGGLLMLDACRTTIGCRPWGFVLPSAHGRGGRFTMQRIDVPIAAPGTPHVLVDPIVNTGATVLATLAVLERTGAVARSPSLLKLACVFLTDRAEQKIRAQHPGLEIFTVWDRMTVEPNGWVTGVGFDAGDYAMGGQGCQRVQWGADLP
jgi:Uracil phosphoribosyltransferase